MSRLPSLGPRGEGWLALQGISFALVAAARWSAPPPDGDPWLVLRLAAVAVALLGAAMIASGIIELRHAGALTAVPHPRAGASLVTSGAFRLVRHPIYGGLILLALALLLERPWLGSLLAATVLTVVLDLKRRREEAWLDERFAGYASYRRATRALIPFVY